MKVPVSVLLSALLIVSFVKANNNNLDREDLDVSDLENNSEVSSALKEGINWIFAKAAEKYHISDLDIEVTKVSKIQKWQEKGDNYFSFDVEAENDDAYIQANYQVKVQSDGHLRVVGEWNYTIDMKNNSEEEQYESENYNESENNEYENELELPNYETNVEIEIETDGDHNKCQEGTQVDVSQVNQDSNLKSALEHGIAWLFNKAHDKSGVSNSNIVVTDIETICTWQKDGDTYYHFDVEAVNANKDNILGSYDVKSGDLRVVSDWSYNIHYKDNDKSDANESDDVDNNNEEQNVGTHQDNEEEEMEIDVEIDLENDNWN